MIRQSSFGHSGHASRQGRRAVFLLFLALQAGISTSVFALPRRLILALDGVAYRDMKALQEGVTYKDLKGRQFHRQGFQQGYFPVWTTPRPSW